MSSRKVRSQLRTPKSRDELATWVGTAGEVQRKLDLLRSRFDRRVAKLKEAYAQACKPFESQLKETVDGIAVYAEANRQSLTENESTKSVDVGTGVIVWRITPPRVTLKNPEGVLQGLLKDGPSEFVRTKHEINREAMLEQPDKAELIDGVTIEQSEVLTVKPTGIDQEIEGPRHRMKRLVA